MLFRSSKIYIPKQESKANTNWFGHVSPEVNEIPVDTSIVSDYFDMCGPEEAECAVVFARGPMNLYTAGGYDQADRDAGGNGYVPISLQYRPYTALEAREVSIAGGDFLEDFTNRSYKGKTVKTYNESDLDMILNTKKLMGHKPVIVVLSIKNPAVVGEFEPTVDGIIVDFSVEIEAICKVLCGHASPQGLLPLQMPIDMVTVEQQLEDVSRDMTCHMDSEGNLYDFGFGLDFNGVIKDDRTKKYI